MPRRVPPTTVGPGVVDGTRQHDCVREFTHERRRPTTSVVVSPSVRDAGGLAPPVEVADRGATTGLSTVDSRHARHARRP
jgi:hypothetical protein